MDIFLPGHLARHRPGDREAMSELNTLPNFRRRLFLTNSDIRRRAFSMSERPAPGRDEYILTSARSNAYQVALRRA